MLDDESPTMANLGNDHGFTSEELYLHWYMRSFGEVQIKAMRTYLQS